MVATHNQNSGSLTRQRGSRKTQNGGSRRQQEDAAGQQEGGAKRQEDGAVEQRQEGAQINFAILIPLSVDIGYWRGRGKLTIQNPFLEWLAEVRGC